MNNELVKKMEKVAKAAVKENNIAFFIIEGEEMKTISRSLAIIMVASL